jgi:hypothetical protein
MSDERGSVPGGTAPASARSGTAGAGCPPTGRSGRAVMVAAQEGRAARPARRRRAPHRLADGRAAGRRRAGARRGTGRRDGVPDRLAVLGRPARRVGQRLGAQVTPRSDEAFLLLLLSRRTALVQACPEAVRSFSGNASEVDGWPAVAGQHRGTVVGHDGGHGGVNLARRVAAFLGQPGAARVFP